MPERIGMPEKPAAEAKAAMADGKKNKKNFKSLAVVLAMIFAISNAAILLVVGGFNIYFDLQSQRKMIASHQKQVVDGAGKEVKDFVRDRLKMLSAAADFNSLAVAAYEGRKLSLEKLIGRERSFRQLVLLDASGEESGSVSRLLSMEAGSLKLRDRIGQDLLLSQARQGKEYISPVYIDETTSEPMAVIAVPVSDAFGDFKGVLMAELSLKPMWDLVGEMNSWNVGEFYVVDESGIMIAYRDIGRVLNRESLVQLKKITDFISGKPSAAETEISKGILGTYVVSSYSSLEVPNWAVIVEVPAMKAYRAVFVQSGVLASVLLLSMALAVLLGVYFSRKVIDPLIHLRDAAVKIGEGSLDTEIRAESRDEIGDLARSFGVMVAKLKKSRAKLEEYNRNLQKKIEQKTSEVTLEKNNLKKSNENLQMSKTVLLNLMEDINESKKQIEKYSVTRKAILESMSDGLVMVDQEGKITVINRLAEKIFSISRNSALGQPVRGAIGNGQVEDSLSGKEEQEIISFEIATSTDGQKTYKVIVSPVTAKEGGLLGKVAIFQDLTKEKEIEEMRKRFVSITAHELRTPLGATKWSLELLKQEDVGKLSVEQRGLIEQLYRSNQRLLDIVADLLEISRIDEERFKVEMQPCQLEDSIDAAAGELILKVKEKNQEFVWKKPVAAMPKVMADPGRVVQILVNLIGNAIKYTPMGKKIRVELKKVSQIAPPDVISRFRLDQKNGEYVQFAVEDEGIGIPQADQERVFDRFFRASNAEKSQIEGTGLGLSISQTIIKLHGGAIWFESEEGKGTKFYFTLPVAEESARLTPKNAKKTEGSPQ